MTHTVYIDLPSEAALAATTGTALPTVTLKLRSAQSLAFAFMTSGVVAAVTGFISGKCVIKEYPGDTPFLLDTSLAVTGSTTTTRYTATWAAVDCDSDALRTFLGTATLSQECFCEVEWIDANGTHSVAFAIRFAPTFLDPDDGAPDLTAALTEGWLTARALRFDAAQSLTTAQKTQALANLGISITAFGYLRLVAPDGTIYHAGLNTGEPPAS